MKKYGLEQITVYVHVGLMTMMVIMLVIWPVRKMIFITMMVSLMVVTMMFVCDGILYDGCNYITYMLMLIDMFSVATRMAAVQRFQS